MIEKVLDLFFCVSSRSNAHFSCSNAHFSCSNSHFSCSNSHASRFAFIAFLFVLALQFCSFTDPLPMPCMQHGVVHLVTFACHCDQCNGYSFARVRGVFVCVLQDVLGRYKVQRKIVQTLLDCACGRLFV